MTLPPYPPLPPQPNLLSDADRATLDPNKPMNPMQKRAAVILLIKQLQSTLQSPECPIGPWDVTITTRTDGISLNIDMPPPTQDQLVLPNS